MAFSSPATSSIYGGVRSGAIETAVNIAHILNERPPTGSAVAVLNGDNWARAEMPVPRKPSLSGRRHQRAVGAAAGARTSPASIFHLPPPKTAPRE